MEHPANLCDTRVTRNAPIQGAFSDLVFNMHFEPKANPENPESFTVDCVENTNMPALKWLESWEHQTKAHQRHVQKGKGKFEGLVFNQSRKGVCVYPVGAMVPFWFRSTRTAKSFFRRYKVEVC